MSELLLNNVSKHIDLDDCEKEFFLTLLQPKYLKRKAFLLTDGEICKHSVFITDGCLRGYTVDKGGNEHILSFAPPGWWIADLYSLFSQHPGNLNIEALTDTSALMLSNGNKEILYRRVPKFERFFRILTENALVANQQRLMDNISLTAEERFRNFCRRYPTLIDQLSQKQVASYLGVTPEFLSRMRNKLVRKKY